MWTGKTDGNEDSIGNWTRDYSCLYVSNNFSTFCFCIKTSWEVKFESDRLISMVEGISTQWMKPTFILQCGLSLLLLERFMLRTENNKLRKNNWKLEVFAEVTACSFHKTGAKSC